MASSTLVLMWLLPLLSLSLTPLSFSVVDQTFHQCLSDSIVVAEDKFFIQTDDIFLRVLYHRAMNRRFHYGNTTKPIAIFIPLKEEQIRIAVMCAKKLGIHLRIRSGGHDYEGASYTALASDSFVILDLQEMHDITVNNTDTSVWVEAGATLGELYYRVQEMSNGTLGFPSGRNPSLGVGGYITGGGDGTMMRKYGLAAENTLDARIINANGEILDRASMGEDVFWAIRGGGGGSYGVIVSWKLRLLPVPPHHSVFNINRTLEQNATKILHKWQQVAPLFDENLFLSAIIELYPDVPYRPNKTIVTSYYGHFLGKADKLLEIINDKIPELGLKNEDCHEMSWLEAVLFLGGYYSGTPTDFLLTGTPAGINRFKSKSDFVKEVIPETGLERIWTKILENEYTPYMMWSPHGGMMSKQPESSIPYPHRDVLFDIQYVSNCPEDDTRSLARRFYALHSLYRHMTQHVSKSPRQAYMNFRDFELGINGNGSDTSYEEASSWGTKYFKDNFKRLAEIKTQFDPDNFFHHEQSIPVIRPQ